MARVVYLIRSGQGLVKIGWTSSLSARLSHFRNNTSDAICLLASVPGGPELEEYLHSKFQHLRVRGEWFEPAEELLTFADELRRRGTAILPAGACDPVEEGGLSSREDGATAVAKKYARRLFELEQERSGGTAEQCAAAVARRVGVTHGKIWALLYRAPKSIDADTYVALADAVKAELLRRLEDLQNQLIAIRASRAEREAKAANIQFVEEGIARLRATLREEAPV